MSQRANSGRGSAAATSESISTSLLDRVKSREAGAWDRLVDLYAPLVYEWCRHCGIQAEDAGDVGQEVFSAVATKVGDFRRDRPGDSFRGWLWSIAQNKIRDHFRRLQGKAQARGGTDAMEQLAKIPDSLPESTATGPLASGASDLEDRIAQLVRPRVEDRTWQAFWAITVEGRPAPDIADELGMSVPAVYKAKYRVIRQIRDELD